MQQPRRGPSAGTRRAGRRTAGPSLTQREREIFELVAAGCSNKQIAQRLSLSEHTIKYYLTHVYRKLGVKGRAQVAEHRLAGSVRGAS
ncbi:MAG: helix-turn-helix transcriptional regulator [Actinomycetota bacterium]